MDQSVSLAPRKRHKGPSSETEFPETVETAQDAPTRFAQAEGNDFFAVETEPVDTRDTYRIALSATLHGWNAEVAYNLRNSYSYRAWRGRQRKAAENIRSIGALIDLLEGIAVLSEEEIAALHDAYLERIPRRDPRQRIDTSGGRYHWLTLSIDFGPFSEVDKADLLRVYTRMCERGIICNTTDKTLWKKELAFRSYVVVFHELVHLQQDLTTGLGAWDWIHIADEKIAQLRRASKCTAEAQDFGQFRMLDGGRTDPITEQEEIVCSSLMAMLGDFGTEYLSNVTIESILEAEAVASTYIHLQASTFADSDEEHISCARDAFHPADLPPLYSSVLNYFVHLVANSQLHTGPGDDVVLACILAAFSCDLSLAVPPPDIMLRGRLSPWEFDPRLSLVRILGHIHEAVVRNPDEVKACVVNLNFPCLASAVLDEIPTNSIFGPDSSLRYKAIYQSWADFFDSKTDPLAVDILRGEAMRIRAKEPFRFSLKNQYLLDVPYIAFNAGFRSLYMEGLSNLFPNLPPEKKVKWHKSLLSHIGFEICEIRALERLIDHYQFGFPFRCPFATSPNCDAWTGGCLDGWASLAQLPPSGCRIREFCQEALLPIS